MYHNKARRITYTNIRTDLPNVVEINPDMIVHQEIADHKKNKKTGELEPIYKQTLNMKYWTEITEPINVIIDEAHSIVNSRRSMSKINIIITDWLALIRRILGESQTGYGELIFITQLPKRIDIIARDMATNVTYCVMHYQKTCDQCGSSWTENSEMPEVLHSCPTCDNINIHKHSHTIEVWEFPNMESFEHWQEYGAQKYFKHYYVNDIENYFGKYNSFQIDNLFSDFYY